MRPTRIPTQITRDEQCISWSQRFSAKQRCEAILEDAHCASHLEVDEQKMRLIRGTLIIEYVADHTPCWNEAAQVLPSCFGKRRPIFRFVVRGCARDKLRPHKGNAGNVT